MATLAARTNWQGLDLDSKITDEPTPPADLEMLALAEYFVRSVFTSPYAGCALIFEGNTAGRDVHHVSQVFAPATTQARAFVTRYGAGTGAQQPSKISGAEAGLGVYTVTASPATGSEKFGGLDTTHGLGGIAQTGTDPAGTANVDAYFDVRELLQATPVAYCEARIELCTAVCFHVPPEGQSADLEVL